jgi:hypothetical protein
MASPPSSLPVICSTELFLPPRVVLFFFLLVVAIPHCSHLQAVTATGNVLRPYTAVKLSIRLPPTADAKKATAAVKQLLEKVQSPLLPLHLLCDAMNVG